MSTFDPVIFEQMILEEANETEFTPVPAGDYQGFVQSAKVRAMEIKKGRRAGQTVPILTVTYALEDNDGKLKELLGRDIPTVRQDIWLDVNDTGGLSFGPNMNVQLGKLRDAVGMNKKGKPFSFTMLEGAGPLLIHVVNEEYNDVIRDRVKSVQAA